jgi:hypothetical protein
MKALVKYSQDKPICPALINLAARMNDLPGYDPELLEKKRNVIINRLWNTNEPFDPNDQKPYIQPAIKALIKAGINESVRGENL